MMAGVCVWSGRIQHILGSYSIIEHGKEAYLINLTKPEHHPLGCYERLSVRLSAFKSFQRTAWLELEMGEIKLIM